MEFVVGIWQLVVGRSDYSLLATQSSLLLATLNPEPETLNLERRRFVACGVIVLAALAAYHNSFSGPFIFDDSGSITGNPTIRHLWPAWKTLSPPSDQTVGGRPLLNLSLALNYALSGDAVWSYHALNLAIHIFSALALFGIVRRTLLERPTSSFAKATEDRSNIQRPRETTRRTLHRTRGRSHRIQGLQRQPHL